MADNSEIIGKRFNKVVVVGRAKDYVQPNGRVRKMYNCKCDCGKEFVVRQDALKNIESCGCQRNKDNAIRQTKHSLSRTRLYNIYYSMLGRCYNTKTPEFNRYGGRGICVCDEWKNDITTFIEWAKNTGYKENDYQLSLERIDVNGNYEPGNCKWIKIKEQYYNRRNSIRIGNLSLSEFCKRAGLKYSSVRSVYYRTGDIVEALGFTNKYNSKES